MKNTCRNAPIPLVASFAGWKGIPWLGWAHNSLSPLLVLHDDHIQYRVIRTHGKPYHVIAGVDYRTAIATTNVVITFTDSITSFAANTRSEAIARAVIGQLADKGCPLSPRAAQLIARKPGEE